MADKNFSQNDKPEANYWRSFEELYADQKTLEAKKHEFSESVTDDFSVDKNLSGISRRKFIALLSASAALAGAGCSDYRDKGEVIPYNVKPEEVTLGKPNYYASTCNGCVQNCGILIKTREGRPIKIDGNPDHPVNKGKICAKGEASILNLYDPSRLQFPLVKQGGIFDKASWESVDSQIKNIMDSAAGEEIAVVTHRFNSPTSKRLFEEFKFKYPSAKIYSYDVFHNEIKNYAWKKCYGGDVFPLIKWNEANIILSLEGDFLGVEGNVIEQMRLFSDRKNVNDVKSFNRLYVAEGSMSLTGMNADYRFRVRPDNQLAFVLSLLNELISKKNISSNAVDVNIKNIISSFSLKDFASQNGIDYKKLSLLVNDLAANRGSAIVYGGRALDEQTQVAVNLLNEVLGNTKLYRTDAIDISQSIYSSSEELKTLVSSMKNGTVKAVIHFDTNPVYHLPQDLQYEKALGKVSTVITLSESENETAFASNYVLPVNHTLESWGDYNVRTGVYSLQQPVISPIYSTRQKEAILLNWFSDDPKNYSEKIYLDYLKKNWLENIFPKISSPFTFEKFWVGALHDGVITTKEAADLNLSFSSSSFKGINPAKNSNKNFIVLITESYRLGDGRYANNGWLQELPHPVSKVTWDNYAAISEKSAKALSVKNNDLIEVKAGNKKMTLPVILQPGVADNFISIETGYGRKNSGVIAEEAGINVQPFYSISDNSNSPWMVTNASVSKVNGSYKVISTQDHQNFDDTLTKDAHLKRDIIQEGTVLQFIKDPEFLHKGKDHKLPNMYDDFVYNDVKWGMSIDLNRCIGCGNCVASCNVENNIPVVGKDQVAMGREMMWLRIDRYYSGTPEEPKAAVQPMLCQHCDQAPCENVCPVAATQHSPDGLNQMVYNRCVGTRYCSNNCPFKVRRFNFFNFRDHYADGYYLQDSVSLMHNPEVTVRSRGVMEKCSFCIQRIMDAREEAIRKNQPLKGSDVRTACQNSCGTEAIKFGNIKDPKGEFYQYRNHKLGYYVLEELNVKPNVTYLAKLRNTHSEEV
ncbi:MAG: TAT-variant-translocated molybdopterin oxidoreductase [Ignavibacteriaceae bacterium]|jgi:molybdopterin-containing oxidoreductase family iron-sulfur binding subunit|nr:TAT-variant-translocated molybdopterin oxidoreductase [Ignavibacteriaceae bacterium]